MDILTELQTAVIDGDRQGAENAVVKALSDGIPAQKILEDGLIAAMTEVGARFEVGDFFVPEMLIAAHAMKAGLGLLKEHLTRDAVESKGKVVIGTVKGDLHDIGKNLVAMMLEGAGYEIVDLGTDVSPQQFVQAVLDHQPTHVGLSALLTTTMGSMKSVIQALEEAGLRGAVKVMVGGAPVTEAYAREIGADGFAPDAGRAVSLAKGL